MNADNIKGFPIFVTDGMGNIAVWYRDENYNLQFYGLNKELVMDRYVDGYTTSKDKQQV